MPRIANTREMGLPLMTSRVRENAHRWLFREERLVSCLGNSLDI